MTRIQEPRTDTHVARAAALHEAITEEAGVELPVRLWDGTELGPDQAEYRIVLAGPWALRSLLLPPSDRSAGEAYVRGDVEVEGDIVAALKAVALLGEGGLPARRLTRLAPHVLALPRPPERPEPHRARLRGRRHSKERDRAAIAFHYDLPQAFYESFLDEALVYSCAYFAHPAEELQTAQRRKLDVVCRKLRLEPGMRVLDIGCGYGALLAHAAERYGASGLGVTLSQTQADSGRRWLAERGLDDRVELRLQDYRDVTGRFDAVLSIGMVEHVGPQGLAEYHARVKQLLRPGGGSA